MNECRQTTRHRVPSALFSTKIGVSALIDMA